ncbi:hypothetical protein [Halpernia sp.]|uniref:hypothetical protein n=1 Tax=Halpernia sp. TaxID=2782209 RepID=UPI003A8D29B2
MKYLFLILSFISFNFFHAQNSLDKTDEMIDEMCVEFQRDPDLSDSIRIQNLNDKFIFNYLNQFSEQERESKIDNLYFRFQKRCEAFRAYLYQKDPPKDDNWEILKSKPEITISASEISQFKNTKNFHYFEYEGAETQVEIGKKYWKETFADGTTSKLLMNWIDKTKFVLEFIESTNNGRKNFSRKGDKYNYELISKEKNYYWILVETPGQNEILKFKLFEEK